MCIVCATPQKATPDPELERGGAVATGVPPNHSWSAAGVASSGNHERKRETKPVKRRGCKAAFTKAVAANDLPLSAPLPLALAQSVPVGGGQWSEVRAGTCVVVVGWDGVGELELPRQTHCLIRK